MKGYWDNRVWKEEGEVEDMFDPTQEVEFEIPSYDDTMEAAARRLLPARVLTLTLVQALLGVSRKGNPVVNWRFQAEDPDPLVNGRFYFESTPIAGPGSFRFGAICYTLGIRWDAALKGTADEINTFLLEHIGKRASVPIFHQEEEVKDANENVVDKIVREKARWKQPPARRPTTAY